MGNNACFIVSELHKLKEYTDVKAGFNVTLLNLLWMSQRPSSAPSAIPWE